MPRGPALFWPTAKDQIIAILKSARKQSSYTGRELEKLLGVNRVTIYSWFRKSLPSPENCLKLSEVLGIDIIDEIKNNTDAKYFWDRFHGLIESLCCSDRIVGRNQTLRLWKQHGSSGIVPDNHAMYSVALYLNDMDGFKEFTEAWYPYYYMKRLEAVKFGNEIMTNDDFEHTPEFEQCKVLPEPPMDGTVENPMTFFIYFERVKRFALDRGLSWTPDNFELYTDMAVAYAYQFFYGDSCEFLPRWLPTLSSEGGAYYYTTEQPNVGYIQIKSLDEFDFKEYLRSRGVIPVITFDKERDTMLQNLQ